jgi:hypothetical protein
VNAIREMTVRGIIRIDSTVNVMTIAKDRFGLRLKVVLEISCDESRVKQKIGKLFTEGSTAGDLTSRAMETERFGLPRK